MSAPVIGKLGTMEITEQQLTRIIYSVWDFQQALSSLTFLLEACDFKEQYDKVSLRRFRCYESSLIVSFSRPFEQTRGGTTIGLRAIGIRLTPEDKALIKKVSELRNKIVAHSSEEEMHFRTTTFPVLDTKLKMPFFQFNEGLLLDLEQVLEIEILIKKLNQGLADFLFKLAQEHPAVLEKYCEPSSFGNNGGSA